MFSNNFTVKSFMSAIIHGPKINKVKPTTMIFGTNDKVASWICVVAWIILIRRPTRSPNISTGPETRKVIRIASWAT